ncbi:transcription factor Sp8-like [Vespula maculifrons]|uniref:Uncharacterized protein n=2 Tax=Vespula TaxID=7451 RepID=A0A834N4E2_VESVU|nr:hypothetical protein HZH66_007222 [Vespula vulgaris]
MTGIPLLWENADRRAPGHVEWLDPRIALTFGPSVEGPNDMLTDMTPAAAGQLYPQLQSIAKSPAHGHVIIYWL